MKSQISFLLKIIIIILAMTISASAGTIGDTYGVSAIGISKGNAMTADVNDWSSVFYNISGLGKTVNISNTESNTSGSGDKLEFKNKSGSQKDGPSHPNEFAVSFLYTIPQFYIDIDRNVVGDQDLHFGSIILGLVLDLNNIYTMPDFISSARFGLLLSTNSDGSLVNVDDMRLETHDFLGYGREAQKSMIMTGIGLGFFGDAFGVGVGVNVSFSGEGAVKLEDVSAATQTPQEPKSDTKMKLSVDPALIAGIYVSPGKLLPVLEGLEFGASYRMESKMEIDPFDNIADAGVKLTLLLAIYDYYQPHIFTIGASYTIWDITVSISCDYQMWAEYKVSSIKEKQYEDQLPELKNIFIPRLGLQFQLSDWMAILGGFYYQPSFIPDKETKGEINFLDNDKLVGSLGLKFDIPQMGGMGGPLVVAIGYQMQYLIPRDIEKNPPNDPDNPDYSYGGTAHTAIITVGMKI